MQGTDSILDGVVEVAEAIIDPSFVKLHGFESLGTIAVFGICAIFIGLARSVEPVGGKAGSVAFGLMLALALLSSKEGMAGVGAMFLAMAGIMKFVSGAALGVLMGRRIRMALLAGGALAASAWVLPVAISGLEAETLAGFKVVLVVLSGIGAYDMLSRTNKSERFSPTMLLGVSTLVAGVGLLDASSLVEKGPGIGVVVVLAQAAFGVGMTVGMGGMLLKRRR